MRESLALFALLLPGCQSTWGLPVAFGQQSAALDSRGFLLVGEVLNRSSSDIKGVRVRMEIWDEKGKLLKKKTAGVEPDPLPAGASGRYEFQLATRPTQKDVRWIIEWDQ